MFQLPILLVNQGFSETVQILLESGAYINQQQTAGETALMKVCHASADISVHLFPLPAAVDGYET